MMYNEFLAGTGAPENKESYNQFKLIEEIYMDCEQMSKAEAYSIWKKTYGKELKAKHKRMFDRANNLLCSVQSFDALPEGDQNKIVRELDKMYWSAWHNKDRSSASLAPNGKTFTDSFGIVWFLKHVANAPNGTCIFGLFASVDGELIDAHYRR